MTGFLVFGIVYLGFAAANGAAWVWLLFAAYGVNMALTEGVGRAFVAGLAPGERRGTFLGLYHTCIGLTAVGASVLAGVLWDRVGPAAPFALGAATGLAAAALLLVVPRRPPALAGAGP
jgi:MFS family permease